MLSLLMIECLLYVYLFALGLPPPRVQKLELCDLIVSTFTASIETFSSDILREKLR